MDWLPLKCMGLEYRVARNGLMGFHRNILPARFYMKSITFILPTYLPGKTDAKNIRRLRENAILLHS